MSVTAVEPVQSFGRAQLVQCLGCLSSTDICFFAVVGLVVEQRFKGLIERGACVRLNCGDPHGFHWSLVRLLNDVIADKSVAVPLDRTDERRLPRVVAQGASQDPDCLAQGTIGDHHVAPDRVEDVIPGHRLVSPLDEQNQQVETARDQCDLSTVVDEDPAGGGQGVAGESVAGCSWRRSHRRRAVYESSQRMPVQP